MKKKALATLLFSGSLLLFTLVGCLAVGPSKGLDRLQRPLEASEWLVALENADSAVIKEGGDPSHLVRKVSLRDTVIEIRYEFTVPQDSIREWTGRDFLVQVSRRTLSVTELYIL